MRVISKERVNAFSKKHSRALIPLNDLWYKLTKMNFSSFNELKEVFSTVDFIGEDRFVFNVGGNKFRLIAMIFFKRRLVYIRGIFTHREYDELCKSNSLLTL
ncbi:mRNA interferase HigB [Chitinophaga skermanii]|uniref:mRNA interferase HigB n=1 Tax=Chitinophaga skermanii TaxID=331697 RepID=A0A327R4B1_9BACT|nr:type II toxin-antitoxin system HigB family toxin [Chitinophaga skermanii]RAJ10782.1 mRNA interferase HigB [Chitinophaga skermanii]